MALIVQNVTLLMLIRRFLLFMLRCRGGLQRFSRWYSNLGLMVRSSSELISAALSKLNEGNLIGRCALVYLLFFPIMLINILSFLLQNPYASMVKTHRCHKLVHKLWHVQDGHRHVIVFRSELQLEVFCLSIASDIIFKLIKIKV